MSASVVHRKKTRRLRRRVLSLGFACGVSLFSRLVMNLLHQRLQRAPADFAKIAIVVRHELPAVTGAVDTDPRPSKIIVGFAQAAIAEECRFGSHNQIRAVIRGTGKQKAAELPPVASDKTKRRSDITGTSVLRSCSSRPPETPDRSVIGKPKRLTEKNCEGTNRWMRSHGAWCAAIVDRDSPTGENAYVRDIRARVTRIRPCCHVYPRSLRPRALSLQRSGHTG
jgi:hypothetical protein